MSGWAGVGDVKQAQRGHPRTLRRYGNPEVVQAPRGNTVAVAPPQARNENEAGEGHTPSYLLAWARAPKSHV